MIKIILLLTYLSIISLFANETTSQAATSTKNKGSLNLKMSDTVLTVGGRVQLDAYLSWPEGIASASATPIDGSGENGGQFNASVKDSRLWVKTITPTKTGTVRSLVEVDFRGNIGDNERNLNGSGVRLRHAFIEVNGVGFGQTNSLFNTFVTPDTIATPVNDTFARQAQIRYTYDLKTYAIDFSLEQPESTFLDKNATLIEPKDDVFPDVITRLRYYPSWGEAAVSVLFRYLNQDKAILSDATELSNQDSALGWGINTSMKYNVSDFDDIRIGLQYGDGMGRYMAYDAFGSGSLDDNGNIDTHAAYGANVSYLHWWSKNYRSTLAFTYAGVENATLLKNSAVNKKASSSHLNLIYASVDNLMYAMEYVLGDRTLENGIESDIRVVKFTARYDF